jgi:acetyltransferase-like isoleucine patch superfamily enzyme
MSEIAPTAKIYANVRLGANVSIGPWAIVGLPPDGAEPGQLPTFIADGAIIRSHAIVYAGSKIGPRFMTGHHALVGPGMEIGSRCSIGTHSMAVGFAEMRDGAKIHGLSYLGEFASVREGAWIGPNTTVASNREQITVVGAGAILAMYVQVLPGMRVGERALVGNGCIIEKDAQPYRLVVGSPIRMLRSIEQIVSPTTGKADLYKPDPPEVKEAALARHELRDGCELSDDNWRVRLWRELRHPELAAAAPSLPAPVSIDSTPQLLEPTL